MPFGNPAWEVGGSGAQRLLALALSLSLSLSLSHFLGGGLLATARTPALRVSRDTDALGMLQPELKGLEVNPKHQRSQILGSLRAGVGLIGSLLRP